MRSTPPNPGALRPPPPGSSRIPRPIRGSKRPRRESVTGSLPKRRRFHSPKRNDPCSPSHVPVCTPKPPAAPQLPSPTPAQSPAVASTSSTLPPFVPAPSPTPPPPLDAASFRLPSPPARLPFPSPPASRYAGLPFRLDEIPKRFRRFFHEDIIPPELYPLFPRGFPYGAPAANVSMHQLTCISLMARQHGRYRFLSHLLEMGANEGRYSNLSFLGTVIIGVLPHLVSYIRPKTPSYKRCCFDCSETFSNKHAVLRHHRPRQFATTRHPCAHSPGCITCATPAEFYRERDLMGAGGLKICYHIYPSAQGTDHFKTQLLQLGQSLLSFALRDLKMTGDEWLNAWNEKEGGF